MQSTANEHGSNTLRCSIAVVQMVRMCVDDSTSARALSIFKCFYIALKTSNTNTGIWVLDVFEVLYLQYSRNIECFAQMSSGIFFRSMSFSVRGFSYLAKKLLYCWKLLQEKWPFRINVRSQKTSYGSISFCLTLEWTYLKERSFESVCLNEKNLKHWVSNSAYRKELFHS